MSKRRNPSLSTKLASALLTMRRVDENGALVPVITFEEAKTLTAKQIISRFEFNHYPVPHALGGPAEPWNLEPMPKADHRKVTNEVDIPTIAKVKRVSATEEEFRRRLLAKAEPNAELEPERPKRKTKWPKRPFGNRS